MNRLTRLLLVTLVLITCVGCDQAVKSVAKEKLASSPPISLLDGIVRLEYAENPGAILSLGANLPGSVRFAVLVVLVSVALAVTIALVVNARHVNVWQLVALSIVTGGGIGNLIDRVVNHGAAGDFVSVGIGPLRTGIFNVADVAIIGGMLLFVLVSSSGGEQREKDSA